jgi:hypothetical protein
MQRLGLPHFEKKIESEIILSFREKFYAMSRIIDPSKEEVGSANTTANERIYPITHEKKSIRGTAPASASIDSYGFFY